MASREQILEAVKDEGWQVLRKSLKGTTTATKLSTLQRYYLANALHNSQHPDRATDMVAVEIRIDNYLKALARGGQLYPGVSLKEALDKNWELPIRKQR